MDLVIAAFLLTLFAAVSYRLCQTYSLRHPFIAQIGIVACLFSAIWFSWSTTYSLKWAEFLPHGSVLFFANASLLLVVAAAGLVFGDKRISRLRKQAVTTILAFTAIVGIGFVLFRPLIQPLELQQEGNWRDEVCLQTHEASCAPAAAATLLGLHGIQTNEQQMAVNCLTSRNGTFSLAAFRGIQVQSSSAGMGTRAIVCEPSDIPASSIDDRLPLFVLVDYAEQLSSSRLSAQPKSYAGRPDSPNPSKRGDERHAVVILKRLENGQFLVADPAVGKVHWQEDYFRSVWVGEGIYLVSK